MMKIEKLLILLSMILLVLACEQKQGTPPFRVLDPQQTGLDFSNDLEMSLEMNIFDYMYFYNGGGVAAGDFNNDGLQDVFFTSNQGPNRLYLNEGQMRFVDVTEKTGIEHFSDSWSNGVSLVDINQDGLLDIYISNVSEYKSLNQPNELWVCQRINDIGIPEYQNRAAEYGLDLSGFCTQALFFDYDRDGDLDFFQMKHSTHNNGTFGQRASFDGTFHPLSGDLLYRNDEGSFTDITREAGIHSTVIGYGLGLAAGDVNNDGWLDLYIGNDFHENDYLYINNQDGTFSEKLTQRLQHTSRFSMGVDIGDMNSDGWQDILSLDMLPEDPEILKKSEGEDALNIFRFKLEYGYNHQYARNNLQINTGYDRFSEQGMQYGIYATDWSWAAILEDFNQDGRNDIFISNGIPKRMNDIDYINFMENDDVQWKIRTNNMDTSDLEIIERLPEIKLKNKLFFNRGASSFSDLSEEIEGNPQSYSNGAVAVDLDNDGDLDIVTNNIDAPATLYENLSQSTVRTYTLKLQGPQGNRNAIGTRVIIHTDSLVYSAHHMPVYGFQSSCIAPMQIAVPGSGPHTLKVCWPDGRAQEVVLDSSGVYEIEYQPTLDDQQVLADLRKVSDVRLPQDVTEKMGVYYLHEENPFVEFLSEPLIPHMTSTEGPALAVGDLNGDGLQDFFIGSSKRHKPALYIQGENGFMERLGDMPFDSMYEETAALWVDVDKDGDDDLVLGSGGSEWRLQHEYSQVQLFLNERGQLRPVEDAFGGLGVSASAILALDWNADGYEDLFVAGRSVPRAFGESPASYFMENNGDGTFRNVTDKMVDNEHLGMITDASLADLNGDGLPEIILGMEWGQVSALEYQDDRFRRRPLSQKHTWTQSVTPMDIDGDGDQDLLIGNLGLNSRLKASKEEPLRLYYNDFDDNGEKEQLLSYYVHGRNLVFSSKMELEKQMPSLKKEYLYAADFAQADLRDIFDSEKLREADQLVVDYLSSGWLINEGDLNFTWKDLPWEAQISPILDAHQLDVDGDGDLDILLGSNYYDANVQMGRYDADRGSVLLNEGNGEYRHEWLRSDELDGQVREIKGITVGEEKYLLVAKNSDSLRIVHF